MVDARLINAIIKDHQINYPLLNFVPIFKSSINVRKYQDIKYIIHENCIGLIYSLVYLLSK